jgi:anti-sigma regulatory factor (Ser/Thr protein kinase)
VNSEISTRPKDFCSFRLPATRRGARLSRHLAVRQLAAWGHPEDGAVCESVALVVAELAANAATHGRVSGRAFELRLAAADGVIRIEVSDTRTERRPPAPAALAPPAADAESGRGLLLVAALSRAWGIAPRDVGKTVWAEIPLGGS